MRLNLGQRAERLSSLFLPLSSSVPTDCGRSDYSLSRRCRKKANRKKGEEKLQRAIFPVLAAYLNSLNIWELRFLWLVTQSLYITKVTQVPPAPRTFTHHSHHHSENPWWLLGLSLISPISNWGILLFPNSQSFLPPNLWSGIHPSSQGIDLSMSSAMEWKSRSLGSRIPGVEFWPYPKSASWSMHQYHFSCPREEDPTACAWIGGCGSRMSWGSLAVCLTRSPGSHGVHLSAFIWNE